MRPIIIGIIGGSASGKTTIAKKIKDTFSHGNSVSIIREDDYYKDQSHLSFEERTRVNYDHPLAFEHDLLLSHLNDLMKGLDIYKPTYDFAQHNRSDIKEFVKVTDVIVIEGLFVFFNEEIRKLLDIKVFVDTPADIRVIRRILRDVKKRGRTVESVINQYLTSVSPMHDQFVEPCKKYADIIIPEGGENSVAIDLLCTKINSIITKKVV